MAADRLDTLKSWVEESPDDEFSRYALAMELAKLERGDEAAEQFEELIRRSPTYHPAYLQFGSLLARLGRKDGARAVFERGLEVTREVGEDHANEEIQVALDALSSES